MIAALDRQKIHAGHGQHSAGPGLLIGGFTNENTDYRDNHHIESGDKSGITGGGVLHTHLLKTGANGHEHTGQAGADEQSFHIHRSLVINFFIFSQKI